MKTIITIVVIIFLAVVGYSIYNYFNLKNDERIRIYEQNRLADSTEIVKLKLGGELIYQRYANVLSFADSLKGKNAKLIADRNEKIMSLTRAELIIKELKSQGSATTVDTVKKQMTFNVDNEVFRYDLFVDFPRRFHKLNYTIKPFGLEVYVTERKTDKIYSGYAVITPTVFQGFVEVGDMNVYIDESLISNKNVPTFFKLGVAAGTVISDKPDFSLGLAVMIREKHYFDSKYGLINKTVNINYSWMFW